MISSHEPTAPEVDALRAELAEVKAERDRIAFASHRYAADREDLRQEVMELEARAEDLAAAHARAVLLKAALVGDITDLRDLMARRATEDYDAASGWPALVTADGVAAALTTILNQEQS